MFKHRGLLLLQDQLWEQFPEKQQAPWITEKEGVDVGGPVVVGRLGG